ncbi:stage V sporulation protein B [Pelagirhabdus alkalitolerans]|uniref:Stage V sporulation protein B n=1 Tax=Pelagirhabdus alkalitolerans TaxID=1612202 RepID=A0A1G6HQL2_9BACI|nr:stage V sporulation protein B [Pelagirhabdus alkalitolerans]SDB96569.1 stage V sporulation protein B [Pelagirhabdus alkalitolerans]
MTKQSFLKGTIILIVAGLITRLLGFVNRIILVRLIEEEGIGLFNMVLPTLFLVYTVSQFGIPLAISKRVSEAHALNQTSLIKKTLYLALIITIGFSLVTIVTLLFCAEFIATVLLRDERSYLLIITMLPIIPITAVSAVLKGYFQGLQNMKPQAYAQVLEQVIRIGTVSFCVHLLLPYGIEFAAMGAILSTILGEISALLFLLTSLHKQQKLDHHATTHKKFEHDSLTLIKKLFNVALPSTGSRFISSISHFLEPILVTHSLKWAGISSVQAIKQYGILTGYALPLLLFPTFMTHALAMALLPSISEAHAKQNIKAIHHRIEQSIRFTFGTSAYVAVLLFIFAEPLLNIMYQNTDATFFIKTMVPFSLFIYIQFPLNATLQALDYAHVAMYNTLIATCVKYVVLIILASQPTMGIAGVSIAICLSATLTTVLHYASIKKLTQFKLKFSYIVKMILTVVFIFSLTSFLNQSLSLIVSPILSTIITVLFSSSVYLILLLSFRIMSFQELTMLYRD